MNWITFHLAGGAAFFSGSALFAAAAAVLPFVTGWRGRTACVVFALTGAGLVAGSATPLPGWAYCGLGAATAVCIVAGYRGHRRRGVRVGVAALALLSGGAAVLAELPHRRLPAVPAQGGRALYVIGDSLSAGMGVENGRTWPVLLREERGLEVFDLSRAGATTGTALGQLARAAPGPGVVLVEIGGNDMFGRTPAAVFAADLDRLLAGAAGPGRVLVMLELPLLPFANAYGRAQRQAAARHGAVLVPKRYLLDVLAGPAATVDGIHLTEAGQRRMAEMVWEVVGPALGG